MLAWRDHDSRAVEAAARDLEKMPPIGASSVTTDLALSLRARVLAAKGQAAAALALLDKERLIIPLRLNNRYFSGRAEHNFFRASLLAKLGRWAEALVLYDAITYFSFSDPLFVPIAHLRKAEIYDEQRDYPHAVEHYRAFAEMWKNCEPMQRSKLEHARKRLGELEAPH
jgi:tetratricopeptide (TPR) repeat protein